MIFCFFLFIIIIIGFGLHAVVLHWDYSHHWYFGGHSILEIEPTSYLQSMCSSHLSYLPHPTSDVFDNLYGKFWYIDILSATSYLDNRDFWFCIL